MIALYERVRLVGDDYVSSGVNPGALGYVIEAYPDGSYEVEFSDPRTGVSLAQLVLREEEFQVAPEEAMVIPGKEET